MGARTRPAAPALTASALGAVVVAVAVAATALAPAATPWKLVLIAALWSLAGATVVAVPASATTTDAPGGAARIGWLLLTTAALFALSALATGWLASGRREGAAWAAWLADRGSAFIVPLTLLALLLVPDGRLPARSWRPVVAVVLGAQIVLVTGWSLLRGPAAGPDTDLPSWTRAFENPLGVLPGDWAGVFSALEPWLLTATLLLVPAAVVVRMRRGRGDERRRVADVLAAAVILVLFIFAGRLAWPAATDVLDVAGAGLLASVLTSVVLRRSMGRASRLVGHALVYSVLAAAVAAVTVGVVAFLRAVDVDVLPVATGLLAAVVAIGLLPLQTPLRRVLVRARQGLDPSEEELVRSLTEQLLQSRQAVVVAREEERAALRRELHDVLGPALAGLRLQLSGLPPVVRSDQQAAVDRLGGLEHAAQAALDDVRRLSRGLRPASLDELGLTGALEDVAEQQGLRLDLQAGSLPALPAGVEVAAYRIGSEALTNAARHSGVGHVELQLEVRDGSLLVRVSDKGQGTRSPSGGVGTTSMRQRAAELGGALTIRDTEGGGTTVEARLPLGTVTT